MRIEAAGLAWLRDLRAGRRWLRRLPRIVQACEKRWELTLEKAYEDSHVSLALAVRMHDGAPAVLKINFPDDESTFEGEALRRWGGNGAVRLVAAAPSHHALLIERCEPGDYLSTVPHDEALEVLVEVLPRLWVQPFPGPPRMTDAAAAWMTSLPRMWERCGRPFETELLHEALSAAQLLGESNSEAVLANQDLHANNVLRARREPWLVIDPKPVIAEREFTLAPIIRSSELGHSEDLVVKRLRVLCGRLRLDPERVRLWTLLHTIAWSFEGNQALQRHVETARWLARLRTENG